MKILRFIVISIFLKYSIVQGYFLDPKDQIHDIKIYAGGNVKFVSYIYYEKGANCGDLDDAEEIIPWSGQAFLYTCTVKKGCEIEFASKMNKSNLCMDSRSRSREEFINEFNSTMLACSYSESAFWDGAPAIVNGSLFTQIPMYYEMMLSYIQTNFVSAASSRLLSCIYYFVKYPIGAPAVVISKSYNIRTTTSICCVKYRLTLSTRCDDNYRGPECLYECISDTRKDCSRSRTYSEEICKGAWITIPINVTISNNNNCGQLYSRNEIIHKCLIINKCKVVQNPPLCSGGGDYDLSCIPVLNNTYVCGKYELYFKNPFYNDITNFTRLNLVNNEIITIQLEEHIEGNTSFQIYNYYWEYYFNTTDDTPTIAARNSKNSELVIDRNKLSIKCKSGSRGYDYTIFAVVRTGENTFEKFKREFIIIAPPNKININNSVYVYYDDKLYVKCDGWPDKYISQIISRYDIRFTIKLPMALPFRFPAWKSKLFTLMTVINLNTLDGFEKNVTAQTYHSTKAFDFFYWKESAYILRENDVLKCVCHSVSRSMIMIRQIYGESEIDDIVDSEITIKNYKPGEYIIACILSIQETQESFHRYKKFEVHKYPKKLCILPFAPAVGMLVKCTCIVFPPGDNDYAMTLSDIETQSIIRSTYNNFLRIPYIILHNRKYRLNCRYKDHYNNQSILLNTNIDFNLDERSEITAISFNRECMDFGTLPDEYLIKESNSSDIYVFYNMLYYLKQNSHMEYDTVILLLAIILNDGMLYIMIGGFKPGDSTEISTIYFHTEKGFRRNFMRRINYKVTNVTTHEFQVSKDLFANFRNKHLSIDTSFSDTTK